MCGLTLIPGGRDKQEGQPTAGISPASCNRHARVPRGISLVETLDHVAPGLLGTAGAFGRSLSARQVSQVQHFPAAKYLVSAEAYVHMMILIITQLRNKVNNRLNMTNFLTVRDP